MPWPRVARLGEEAQEAGAASLAVVEEAPGSASTDCLDELELGSCWGKFSDSG